MLPLQVPFAATHEGSQPLGDPGASPPPASCPKNVPPIPLSSPGTRDASLPLAPAATWSAPKPDEWELPQAKAATATKQTVQVPLTANVIACTTTL
jgi:hypothetical protein